MIVPRRTVITVLLIATLTSVASAHVTVKPNIVAAGSVDVLTFRCPNERAGTATTQLIVQMPEDVALKTVRVRPAAGWHAAVTLRAGTSIVDTIAWSGGSIPPGAHHTFAILAGPMPHGPRALAFKAVQTYANGETVRWIELRNPGEAAPALPAPVVRVR